MAMKGSQSPPAANTALMQWPARLTAPEQQLVLDSAKMAWLAYSDPDTVKTWWSAQQSGTLKVDPMNPAQSDVMPRITKLPQFISCPSCDAQCYLLLYTPPPGLIDLAEPMLVIAARGTTSLMDWMCDAEAYQTKFRDATDKNVNGGAGAPPVEVHAGFYKQFIALLSQVDNFVQKHLTACPK